MHRLDLFTPLHKGLRRGLFETALAVGRTDFARGAERAATLAAVRELLLRLEEHAAHEDAAILPELAGLAPELHADLRADHARLRGLEREVAGLLARLEDAAATAAERCALGRLLTERTAGLAAEHVRHMAREEREASRILWAHRGDAELRALEARGLAPLSAAHRAEWLALVLPALAPGERADVLARLTASEPRGPRATGASTEPALAAAPDPALAAGTSEATGGVA